MVHFCSWLNASKGKAKITKIIGESLQGQSHIVGIVGLSYFDTDQGLELVFAAQVIALQLNARDDKALTFIDIDRDHNVLSIGRDGHLGGINSEL